jgi:hypothetical protein
MDTHSVVLSESDRGVARSGDALRGVAHDRPTASLRDRRIAARPFCCHMKPFCLCLVAVLGLSSCTEVKDFGLYWDKGFIDPALEGSWKKLGQPGKNRDSVPGPDLWRFTRNGSSHSLQSINPVDETARPDVVERQKADNEERVSVRTLRIGKHLFLMQRGPAGQGVSGIVRYDVQRGTLQEYWTDNGAVVEFLMAKHPTAKNIKKAVGPGVSVVIDTFDDEVFRVLSEIADNPAYWTLNCR